MIQIRTVAFAIVLRQYAFPTLKRLCFQTKNLSTDGMQAYEIKYIKTLFWKVVSFARKHLNQSQQS